MLLEHVADFCDKQYFSQDTQHACSNCHHQDKCSGGCISCLEEIHYPANHMEKMIITTIT